MPRVLLIGVVLVLVIGADAPAAAQEPRNAVGVTLAPRLRVHDEATCCVGIAAWLQLGRLQIEQALGVNVWDRRNYPDLEGKIEGLATTVLWDVATLRQRSATTRFRAGLAYRVSTTVGHPPGFTLTAGWTFNVGLVVDLPRAKRAFVRAGLRGPFPEPQLGVGFPF